MEAGSRELECPVCGEILALEEDVLEVLNEGDLLECEACSAVVEVMSLDPLEIMVVEGGHGFFVDCPRCEAAIEVEEEGPVVCPECGFTFRPDWSDVEEEEE
ncbi:hypothetical protein [Marinithermus hydrothermalis]|uniref:Paraquat-inducible protein A n=1 Tax=Marinithermus hydrothermalis (strain DSM 14884 / JCM 11576 / T1) TaxID=869210 RepID=F2NL17_MARHT|nr:hypothetical protein [Marinithermus hydrothermalis]AEB11420.1 hypothetical protein Marky_0670 [Marinithermus hydrothermalis DSM 14884]